MKTFNSFKNFKNPEPGFSILKVLKNQNQRISILTTKWWPETRKENVDQGLELPWELADTQDEGTDMARTRTQCKNLSLLFNFSSYFGVLFHTTLTWFCHLAINSTQKLQITCYPVRLLILQVWTKRSNFHLTINKVVISLHSSGCVMLTYCHQFWNCEPLFSIFMAKIQFV